MQKIKKLINQIQFNTEFEKVIVFPKVPDSLQVERFLGLYHI